MNLWTGIFSGLAFEGERSGKTLLRAGAVDHTRRKIYRTQRRNVRKGINDWILKTSNLLHRRSNETLEKTQDNFAPLREICKQSEKHNALCVLFAFAGG